jgi:hypothetical protein
MERRITLSLRVLAFILLASAGYAPAAHAQGDDARYALVHGCYALKSASGGFVAKDGRGGYRASADQGDAEPFRMQATALGRYLLYGRQRDFLAAPSSRVETAPRPSEAADWRVDTADGGGFRLSLPSAGKRLAVGGGGGLTLSDAGDVFSFEKADGCATYPESEVNVSGEPTTGPVPYSEVSGLLDAHIHMMAYEFLGGSIHCGRPWHAYGITHAMVDCPDHEPSRGGPVLENAVSPGAPGPVHDTTGWPTFKDWPHHASLTHEQTYYKWLERAWRAGLRIYVNLLVDNAVLCEIYPYKRNSCNEMEGVRLQARRIRELESYIDAQSGGPGKGWFRIVTDPFEARRVINEGKLAVVQGIEVSKLFDCGLDNGRPECDTAHIDRALDEVYRLGVRDMELVNKFDNAFTGVAGDGGTTGVATNTGNRYETGQYMDFEPCTGPAEDRPQVALPGTERDTLVGNTLQFLPGGIAPVYPAGPQCNTRGLSPLGEHLVRRMMEKKMIIDPDHMSVAGRNQLLAIVEAANYSGIVSSHSWSTEDSIPRIYQLGGVVTPYAGNSTTFAETWRKYKPMRNPRYYWGFGYGADMNGFGAQGSPRKTANQNGVEYPFKSFDGKQTVDRAHAGQRTWDINNEGVPHYGLYPDWVEDLRKIAGDEIVEDMGRGAEAYLQMWERAEGIAAMSCRSARGRLTRTGLFSIKRGDTPNQLLRRAGQPASRKGRTWRYCVQGNRNRKAEVTAVYTPSGVVGLVGTNAYGHRAMRVGRGMRASRLRGKARRFGKGVLARRIGGGDRIVYGVRKGRVSYMAVASRSVAKRPGRLRPYLKLAGLR